jgi:glutamate racemase
MLTKIGVFDSGVGGLSIWREIVKSLPQAETVYLADQLYLPYGNKTDSWLVDRCLKISRFFSGLGISIVVIACNSATAAAIAALRRQTGLLYVGVEPAIKPAAKLTKTGEIAVLATEKTLNSRRHSQLIKIAAPVKVRLYAAPEFVKLVEKGDTFSSSALQITGDFFSDHPLGRSDVLVLGCTHYPFLVEAIRQILGKQIKIVDPAGAVVNRLVSVIGRIGSAEAPVKPVHRFYTTGNQADFSAVAEKLIGLKIKAEKAVL